MASGRLDGVRPARSADAIANPKKATRPPKTHRRWWWQTLGIVLAIGLIAASAWAQPILAALPIQPWPDRLALTSLLRPGKYLVLFQNPRELRATGGFLGSFAEVDLGWALHVNKIQVETNIYTRDTAYASSLNVDPPEPLKEFLGDQPWAMRDSNWALDFPEAAQTVSWFYQHEGGQAVDGVIAIDARLLERLLRATGPIVLPRYQTILTADNVVDQLQQEVEKNYWQDQGNVETNQPKQILADLLPALISRLKHLNPAMLADTFVQAFIHKEILVAMSNPTVAAAFEHADWAGAVQQTADDYLYINESNLTPVDGRQRIVGAKSSWSMGRTVKLDRTTAPDGSVVHQLSLHREHDGKAIWPDGPNDSFLRVAVPSGATLVKATRNGTNITSEIRQSQEAGKTVFGFWSRLQPGDKEDLTLTYQTKAFSSSKLDLQMQPGLPSLPIEAWTNGKLDWRGDLTQDYVI